jgi:hypothetical protein
LFKKGKGSGHCCRDSTSYDSIHPFQGFELIILLLLVLD